VRGVVNSTTPGGFSAAVRGENRGTGGLGIGVWGSQNGSGWGVYATSSSGAGVEASSGSGTAVEASGAIGVRGFGSTGDGVDGSSTSAIGVSGAHSATNGTAAGVQGTTASTDSSANAIYGVVSSTSPGGFSSALRGQNNGTSGSGIGVYGSQAGSGWGVYGTTPSGVGVLGTSGSGTGVYASSSTGNALSIGSGGIQVASAGLQSHTAAFVHLAVGTNTSNYITTINNPLCNGKAGALLFVTHNYSPPGVSGNYEPHPYSVWFNGSNWTIYNDDFASITNMSFNVLIITP
jgi:hypothetical protein